MTLRSETVTLLMATLRTSLISAGLCVDASGAPLPDPDVTGHLKEPLDTTDLLVELVPASLNVGEAYLALARWQVLLRIQDEIPLSFIDLAVGGDSFQLSKAVAAIERRVAEARQEALVKAGPAAVAGVPIPASEPAGPAGIRISWSGRGRSRGEFAQW